MRIHAVSDLHIDHAHNRDWLSGLSNYDYQEDVLILGGDISDDLDRVKWCFEVVKSRFSAVLFVPGNHDLWVIRDPGITSLDKFDLVENTTQQFDVETSVWCERDVCIVPFLGWYDYSFGAPGDWLSQRWMDFRACRWPEFNDNPKEISDFFWQRNQANTSQAMAISSISNKTVISFSHFLPRIDVMPKRIPAEHRRLYPVLGSQALDTTLREIGSTMHIYGHSHVNRSIFIDEIHYINNAFGYPKETRIASKALCCVYGDDSSNEQ